MKRVICCGQVGLLGEMAPCAQPATVSLDITGPDGFDYPIATMTTGTNKTIEIPGLSVGIPELGDAGVFVDFQLDGNTVFSTPFLHMDPHARTCVRPFTHDVHILSASHCHAFPSLSPRTGDVSQLVINLGVDACMEVLGFETCGSKLTTLLPIWVIQETLDFSTICPSK